MSVNQSKLQMLLWPWRTFLKGTRDRIQISPTAVSLNLKDMAYLVRPELCFHLGAPWSHQDDVLLCDA
jgi:hypothetical protein